MADLFVGHGLGSVRLEGTGYDASSWLSDLTYSPMGAVSGSGNKTYGSFIDLTTTSIDAAGIWFHGAVASTTSYLEANMYIFEMYDSLGAEIFSIFRNGSNAETYRLNNSSGTDVAPSPAWGIAGLKTFDLHIYYTGGTTTVVIYNAGLPKQTLTFSGVVGNGDLKTIRLGACSTALPTFWSELIVSTDSTIGCRVLSRLVSGAGTYSETLGDWHNIVSQDNLQAEFTDVDQRITAVHAGIGTLPGTARSFALMGRVAADDIHVPVTLIRTNSTDVAGTSPLTTNKVMSNGYQLFVENPVTAAPWSNSEINAIEFGFKSIAKP